MDFEPPFEETYKTLLKKYHGGDSKAVVSLVEVCELPLINLSRLSCGHRERDKCISEMVNAATNLGFFQVINHGISKEVLKNMIYEQKNVFHQLFQKKVKDNFLNLSTNCYRWGNLKATRLSQFSWSEAFHIAITDIPRIKNNTLRVTTEKIGKVAAGLAKSLAEILAQHVGVRGNYFQDKCPATSSYLRLNRYPPCPYSSKVFGLIPHTDTDFLTILYQDQVGGLQLLKDGKWFAVQPNPDALIVNIGDLFQAMSNCVYRSSKHRVVSTQALERFSVAYFYCPSDDAIIRSCSRPPVYRDFSFKEYKQQSHKDVQETGDKLQICHETCPTISCFEDEEISHMMDKVLPKSLMDKVLPESLICRYHCS